MGKVGVGTGSLGDRVVSGLNSRATGRWGGGGLEEKKNKKKRSQESKNRVGLGYFFVGFFLGFFCWFFRGFFLLHYEKVIE